MRSTLDHYDEFAWHTLPKYSSKVRGALARAYLDLNCDGGVASYLRASNAVSSHLRIPMALPQRLRILHVKARAQAALGRYSEALALTAHAIEIAEQLGDHSALSALFYFYGAMSAALLHYVDAADSYMASRGYVRMLPIYSAADDLRLTGLLAMTCFFMGQAPEVEEFLNEAYRLIPLAPNHPIERATISWVEANRFRWRGEPERALRPALDAEAIYSRYGAANSAARIHVLVASSAVDLAGVFPLGSDRDAMLRLAHPHIEQAQRLTAQIDDPSGALLTQLPLIRAQRLAGRPGDRVAKLERVIRGARRLDDEALVAQAFTTLADEFTYRGEVSAARSCHQQVLAMLDGSELEALTVWSRRALA